MPANPEAPRLAFILSTPRAGSTLLAAMLGSHSAIDCPPEPWLLLALRGLRDPRVVVAAPFDFALTRRALGDLLDDADFTTASRAFAVAAYDTLRARTGKPIVVDKTPRYYGIVPWLRALFPEAPFVWLKRNPLDVIASHRATWDLPMEQLLADVISAATFDVTLGHRLLADAREQVPGPWVDLRYEDLVMNPTAALAAVCAVVGVPFEAAMVEYGANTALLQRYGAASMGDREVLKHARPEASRIGHWRTVLSPDEAARALSMLGSRLFSDLGYVDEMVEAASFAGVDPTTLPTDGRLPELAALHLRFDDRVADLLLGRESEDSPLFGAWVREHDTALRAEADHLKHQLAGFRAELDSARARLDEKERVIQSEHHAAEERRRLLEQVTEQYQVLQMRTAQLEGEHRQVVEARTRDAADLAASKAALASAEGARADALARQRQLDQILDESRRRVEEQRSVIQTFELAVRRAEDDAAELRRLFAGSTALVDVVQGVHALRGEVLALQDHAGTLAAEQQAHGRTRDALRAAQAETARHLKGVNGALRQADERRHAYQQTLDAVQRQLHELERENERQLAERELRAQHDSARLEMRVLELEAGIRETRLQRELAEAVATARLRVIEDQKRAIDAYRRFNLLEQLRLLFAPKLGVLYQHAPIPMRVPPSYNRTRAPEPPPRISIVTPSYNQAAFIERTLHSVLLQQYPNLEYVVQDGGSTDSSMEIVERLRPGLAFAESRKDNGQAHAINLGFAHTSGEIMAYLNSDDLLLPGSLAYVARFFARHPNVDVVYGHRYIIDEYDAVIGRWVLPPHDDRVLTWADYVPQETLFWRRSIWERSGGHMDESFRFALDWDLILRFRDAGARFRRLPRFLGGFRFHPHQKTSAQMQEIGSAEMQRLRNRSAGRQVAMPEVHAGERWYMLRHVLYDKLYRLGLVRY
ncbi:MAG: sulfotransferase [Chloroflexi bacterium]|nr:sulfotransferase [Chloroflexota bacterium]